MLLQREWNITSSKDSRVNGLEDVGLFIASKCLSENSGLGFSVFSMYALEISGRLVSEPDWFRYL